jgi:flagellar motor switch protein FliN/FliY
MVDNDSIGDVLSVTDLDNVLEVNVEVWAVLGTSKMPISQVLKLGRGAVVELNRLVGDPIELHAKNILVAKGDITVIGDKLGITIGEIVKLAETTTT